MTTIPFPISIRGEFENRICVWIGENIDGCEFSEDAFNIIFLDDELALLFRLKFCQKRGKLKES